MTASRHVQQLMCMFLLFVGYPNSSVFSLDCGYSSLTEILKYVKEKWCSLRKLQSGVDIAAETQGLQF